MRALFAGLFVFTTTLIVVHILSLHSPNHDLPSWGFPVILATLFLAIISSLFIFNIGAKYRPSGKTFEERIKELEEQDLLLSENFKALRVFEVQEFEDEGMHFFIELQDHAVLYLSGQSLYDYAAINPRLFPCSEFTVRRHKINGWIVDIVCGGNPLIIECEAPPFDKKDAKFELIPEDGQIFSDRTYDELKKERLKGRAEIC